MAIPILRQNASTKYSYKLDKLKEGEKISIVADSMFHAMLNNESRKKFSAYLISMILNVPFDEIFNTLQFVNNKLDKNKSIEKNRTVDFLCKINDEYVGIEMNNIYSPTKLERNISYASDIYKKNMKTGVPYDYNYSIQIDLNNFTFNNDKIIDEFELKNKDGESLTDKIKFIYIYLPNIHKKRYNIDELSELEKFILVMCEQNINICKDLAKGNKIMEEYVDDAVYASNDEVLDIYDAEVIKQMEMQDMKRQGLSEGYDAGRTDGYDAGVEHGIETGKREQQLEIAKNMLNKNIDIETIISCTGLSKQEIENL